MPYSPIPQFNVGQQVTSAQLNQISTDLSWIYAGRPALIVWQGSTYTTSIADQTWATLGLDQVDYDTASGWAYGNGVKDHYTAQVSGWYLIMGTIAFNKSLAAGRSCAARITVNGVTVAGISSAPLDMVNGSEVMVSRMVYLAKLDYTQLQGYQDSGATVTTKLSGSKTTYLGTACSFKVMYFGG